MRTALLALLTVGCSTTESVHQPATSRGDQFAQATGFRLEIVGVAAPGQYSWLMLKTATLARGLLEDRREVALLAVPAATYDPGRDYTMGDLGGAENHHHLGQREWEDIVLLGPLGSGQRKDLSIVIHRRDGEEGATFELSPFDATSGQSTGAPYTMVPGAGSDACRTQRDCSGPCAGGWTCFEGSCVCFKG